MILDVLAVVVVVVTFAACLGVFVARVDAPFLGMSVVGLALVAALVWAIGRIEDRLAGRSR